MFIKNKILMAVLTVISLGIFFYFLLNVDLIQAKKLLLGLDYKFIILALVCYLITQIFKTIRFRSLIFSQKISLRGLLKIELAHSFFCRLMPFKTGELSYIFLLRERYRVEAVEGLSTLAIARVFDIFIIFIFLAAAVFLNMSHWLVFYKYLLGFIILGLILFIIYFFILNNQRVLNHLINYCSGVKRGSQTKLILVAKIKQALEAFIMVNRHKKTGQIILITLLFWGVILGFDYFLILSLGLDFLNLYQIFLLLVIINIAAGLPISAAAEAGTLEGGFVFTLLFFGINKITAINQALVFHLLLLIISLIFFLVFLLDQICAQFFLKKPIN
jgi:uncharacterized protein (TIRG00374 family)